MSNDIFKKIPYNLLVNICYIISIFFILISIDNCIWYNYEVSKIPNSNNIEDEKEENNERKKKIFNEFVQVINNLLENLKINGSLNFICIKSELNINEFYKLYADKTSTSNKSFVNYNPSMNDKIAEINSKFVNLDNLKFDDCFYINKNLIHNFKNLLLKKIDNSSKKKYNDISKLNINEYYKSEILDNFNNYISKIRNNINLFFTNNSDKFEKIDIVINITNYIKTIFRVCVLLIVAKLLLSIFTGKKWLSLLIIPFLAITAYFVFYFIKDNKDIGIPKGLSIKGVGIKNMLIGCIMFYVSLLFNLLF